MPLAKTTVSIIFWLAVTAAPALVLLGWVWLLKRTGSSGRKRLLAVLTTTLATGPLLATVYLLGTAYAASNYPRKPFTQSAWLKDAPHRYELVADLIDSNMLIGKTKAEARALLGQEIPLQPDYWVYSLGAKPTMDGEKQTILGISFKRDAVVSAIQQDLPDLPD